MWFILPIAGSYFRLPDIAAVSFAFSTQEVVATPSSNYLKYLQNLPRSPIIMDFLDPQQL